MGELKVILCPIKKRFQGQRNPQNCKNPSKITSFKAQTHTHTHTYIYIYIYLYIYVYIYIYIYIYIYT